ncbi:hypothetical protein BaRGS_00008600 [Batillaria attramentaria]|uniref:Carboxylic ester hydrolase n=1 Tax=Batillaria attramentaria TaxID=370345 RepID=A0ABD0LLJ3_9CAEN
MAILLPSAPCMLLMFVVFTLTSVHAQTVNVTVPDIGVIVGKAEDVTLPDGHRSTVAVFRGIPYAEPPVGQLRFAKPVPKANLTTPFQALQFGPICPQRSSNAMSEDCLHVNVFVPSAQLPVIENVTKPLAVFVWIHGGAFQQGSGNIDGKSLATFGNIIVVSINYRLGALGFLTTLDQEATGNYGLWDQRLALQWVKTNIRAFGGDPDEITIGGGSAGGFSVSFQSLHAENEGLFRRFIAESGNAISVMNNRDNAAEYTKVLARQLACDTTSSQTIVSCLRQKNFTDIATKLLLPLGPFELPWGPAIDGDFFQQNPSDEITWPPSKADLSVVKSMDGIFVTAGAEGSVSYDMWVRIIAKQLNQTVTHGVSKQVFDKVIDGMLSSQKQSSDPQIISAIVYEYTDWEDPDNPATLGQSTVDLLTDQQWFVPNVVFSRNHALNNNHTSTYLLQFDQKPLSRGWLHGAPHVAYGRYVWGAQGNDKEWELSKVFMTYWSNFIKTGNPNSPSPTHTQWLPFDVHDEHYLLIDNDVSGISDGKHCKARRTDFWLDYLPGVKVAAARNHGDVNPATRKPDCSASAGERPLGDRFWLLMIISVVTLAGMNHVEL